MITVPPLGGQPANKKIEFPNSFAFSTVKAGDVANESFRV